MEKKRNKQNLFSNINKMKTEESLLMLGREVRNNER
jgi:hypothetical protein